MIESPLATHRNALSAKTLMKEAWSCTDNEAVSFMQIINDRGLRIAPWGTPALILTCVDVELFILIYSLTTVRQVILEPCQSTMIDSSKLKLDAWRLVPHFTEHLFEVKEHGSNTLSFVQGSTVRILGVDVPCRLFFERDALIVWLEWTYKMIKLLKLRQICPNFANNWKKRNWSVVVRSSHTFFLARGSFHVHVYGNLAPSENDG